MPSRRLRPPGANYAAYNGAAALVMADFAGVGYLTIIIAILVPVIAYYASLMTMVYFETKRLGIQPNEEDIAATPVPHKQDYLNLLMIFGPLLVIVYLLIQGMSPAGASITALALLFPLSLVNPEIRQRPFQLIQCLANGGSTFAGLLMAIAAVSIVISALSATGVPVKFGVLLNSMVTDSLLVSLLIAAIGCVILGMGMPTLPAYVTVATIAIPAMQILGLDTLTAHMFVFMIAIGSSITPPVAIAAYAAATISGGKPIRTSVDASRIGVMMFLIPFMFAYNPVMLSVDQANVQFAWLPWFWVVGKLLISIPLLSTALIGFDNRRLSLVSVLLRICCVVLMFVPDNQWDLVGVVGAIILVFAHRKFSFHQDSTKQGAAL